MVDVLRFEKQKIVNQDTVEKLRGRIQSEHLETHRCQKTKQNQKGKVSSTAK